MMSSSAKGPISRGLVRSWFALLIWMLLPCGGFAAERQEALVVFAAASLTNALEEVTVEFTRTTGIKAKLSFAASSALARQIESGARADVFFSADQEWMDYLANRGLVAQDTRVEMLTNRLVLIAPRDSKVVLKLAANAPLLNALGARGRLATGDPESVPVGRYAKQALIGLDLWNALEPRLVRADNVRVALMYVARGEVPLGIVYATDAASEPQVRIVDTFPAGVHEPINYPVAVTTVAQPEARAYVEFLEGAFARAIFERTGFGVSVK